MLSEKGFVKSREPSKGSDAPMMDSSRDRSRIARWLFAPSTLPASPPWWLVFVLSGLWNVGVGCWWGAGICALGAVALPLLGVRR